MEATELVYNDTRSCMCRTCQRSFSEDRLLHMQQTIFAERALTSSYRPSIVTFPLSTRFKERVWLYSFQRKWWHQTGIWL